MDRGDRPVNDRKLWTREELILALELYCRIPFQKTKTTNPEIKKLARLLNRTPASVARKLGNFGAFDPQLKRLEITGLTHVGHLDREIWMEFSDKWACLAEAANGLRRKFDPSSAEEILVYPKSVLSERIRPTKQRLHQAFFRDAVLSSYNGTCCVTGLPIPECLVASHIIPWSENEDLRADPTNGLCLIATFDKLFDRGLITISNELTLLVNNFILRTSNPIVRQEIADRHGQPIIHPTRFFPRMTSLQWHRDHIFIQAP